MQPPHASQAVSIHGVSHQAPARTLPAGSCDCHTHVFGPSAQYPMAPDRQYTPGVALLEDLLRLHDHLGIQRVVIVHPSPYGSDNTCTLDALRSLGGRGRGVAVIDAHTTDAQLQNLHDAGVRGVRINLETNGIEDTAFAARQVTWAHERVRSMGWHLQLYTNLAVFASLARTLDQVSVPVVLDHFARAVAARGIDQPHFAHLLARVRDGQAWVKLSAPHRISDKPDGLEVSVIAQTLIAANPDRMLWGSDWPHPGVALGQLRQREVVEPFNPIDDGRALNRFLDWEKNPSLQKKILVDNPAELYRFPPLDK